MQLFTIHRRLLDMLHERKQAGPDSYMHRDVGSTVGHHVLPENTKERQQRRVSYSLQHVLEQEKLGNCQCRPRCFVPLSIQIGGSYKPLHVVLPDDKLADVTNVLFTINLRGARTDAYFSEKYCTSDDMRIVHMLRGKVTDLEAGERTRKKLGSARTTTSMCHKL